MPMSKFKSLFGGFMIGLMVLFTAGCTRIETGEVGVRIDASRQIQGAELQPGSWNQTLIGSVLEFPVKDINVVLNDKRPMTADNTPLTDFDVSIVYSINPASVSELYSTKSRSFHAEGDEGIFLMYEWMATTVNNAAYKVVRQYEALKVADSRAEIEQKIVDVVNQTLREQKLDTSLNLVNVQVRSVIPNQAILDSATQYVAKQNELKVKETEVEIAKKESERMAALANNSTQSIAYMQAQAALNISEGIKEGKVQTIIVPSDFTALMMK